MREAVGVVSSADALTHSIVIMIPLSITLNLLFSENAAHAQKRMRDHFAILINLMRITSLRIRPQHLSLACRMVSSGKT